MSRLAAVLADARAGQRTALMPFLTVGYPDMPTFLQLVKAMVEGGAEGLELGIPFSDPLADGPSVQKANFRSLQNGTRPRDAIDAVSTLRRDGVAVPLVLMGYWNTFLAAGEDRFISDAAAAGADGFIVVDLPPEESDAVRETCRSAGVDLVYLLAPTSDDRRIDEVVPRAGGFIYCVGVVGVTGARTEMSRELPDFLRRVRHKTEVPLAVGFGISKREHVVALRGLAEAAIVGAAIIDLVESSPREEQVKRVKAYVEVLTGRRKDMA
ncbi:MAG: tryptophan synthase subunit alpha [Chloroflexi bacterium]|nr:tryptophan synthase subunit alpha [Chloroflexota bacterium]